MCITTAAPPTLVWEGPLSRQRAATLVGRPLPARKPPTNNEAEGGAKKEDACAMHERIIVRPSRCVKSVRQAQRGAMIGVRQCGEFVAGDDKRPRVCRMRLQKMKC